MQIAPHFLAFLPSIGGPEILIILAILLLLFGAKRLPELARGMGKSIKEFKKATTEIEDDFKSSVDDPPKKPTNAAPRTTESTAQSDQAPSSTPSEPTEAKS